MIFQFDISGKHSARHHHRQYQLHRQHPTAGYDTTLNIAYRHTVLQHHDEHHRPRVVTQMVDAVRYPCAVTHNSHPRKAAHTLIIQQKQVTV